MSSGLKTEVKEAVSELRITTGHGLILMQAYEQNENKLKLKEWIEVIEDSDLSVR